MTLGPRPLNPSAQVELARQGHEAVAQGGHHLDSRKPSRCLQ